MMGPEGLPDKEALEQMEQRARRMSNVWVNRILGLAVGFFSVYTFSTLRDVNSPLYPFVTQMLQKVDPETAHDIVMWAAAHDLLPEDLDKDDPAARVALADGQLRLPNPVGLAAGFDKNAEGPLSFLKMGFGFVEVGSVCPEPQSGNPTPRIFRLGEDAAIVNRCGFNSDGIAKVEERLKAMRKVKEKEPLTRMGKIGVNLGKNKTSTDAAADIREGARRLGPLADYLVINVSSPNTPGLRALQQRDELAKLVDAAQEEIGTFKIHKPPLFIKIAPDLSHEDKKDIADLVLAKGVEGLIVSNTTVSRPESLKSPNKTEEGGLSGWPLKEMSTECVRDMYRLTQGKVDIIACGGVFTGRDLMEKIDAGASAVQIYTSMVYRGPSAARMIKNDLAYIMFKRALRTLRDAVGKGVREADDGEAAAKRPKKSKKPKKVPKPSFDV
ncbi:unnamed protein product [Vitrella brassicaformis CCMP3155]|uniref:Dihydroorotate dehydrogenase catalytic domain-containing protein n=2 Tax=Vitrella brassicaformis TaxID=1169539 RepID=A0A0G4EFR0_VITBC|nr:unnamed protein product [Vitrella brassicaformis CCMP3155]|eukprot:CEL94244.1 unnamed protein product [Vitrella brassicaformis CCMP3155]